MCTSTDDCFCHEQVRQSRSPNCSYAQTSRSSAEIVSGGSCRAGVAKQHLLERVAAEAEPERLQRDDLLGRDVAEVDLGAELLDEPRLRGLRRRLEDDVARARPPSAISPISSVRMPPDESKMPAVPPSRASVITFQAPASSSSWSHCVHSSAVYSTDESFEPTSERTVKSRAKSAISSSLLVARDVDRPVGDLDVREAELAQPALVVVELAERVDDLEEGPADHDRLLAQDLELALRGSASRTAVPQPSLTIVDVLAGRLEDVLPARAGRGPCRARA